MKKVFLSAIMVIAFVGTSMANDIAEKEVVDEGLVEKTLISNQSISSTPNCGGVYGSTRIYALNHGASKDQADCIAWAAYTRCLGFTDLEKANAVLDMGPAC